MKALAQILTVKKDAKIYVPNVHQVRVYKDQRKHLDLINDASLMKSTILTQFVKILVTLHEGMRNTGFSLLCSVVVYLFVNSNRHS